MCPDIVFFLNLIFDTGIEIGIIKRIYKIKGDRTLPENYRPLTLGGKGQFSSIQFTVVRG